MINGGTNFRNRATPIVQEFLMRKSLARLGFVSSISELPFKKAEYFVYIDGEIHKQEDKKLKAKSKGGGRRRGR